MAAPMKWFPGKGWITDLLNKLSPEMRKTVRQWSLFKPDDINDLYPSPRTRISYPGVDRIKGFRYPTPGNQKDVHVPQSESDDRLYDIGYYVRDTRRKPREIYSWTPDYLRVALPPSPEPAKAMGSPGNKNPAVLAYDPTGLRSAMSATNAELEKSLQRHAPNHLVYYEWEKDEEKIIADCKAKGLAVPPGRRWKATTPDFAKQARW